MNKFENIFEKNYKYFIIVPLIILVLAFVVIGNHYSNTGDIVDKDVSLRGGITATIYTEYDSDRLESDLRGEFGGVDLNVRRLSDFGTNVQKGVIIEISEVEEEDLTGFIEGLGVVIDEDNYSIEQMGSSLGEQFYRQMAMAMLLAFLFMGIVILIAFRTFIPSVAVVFAAFFDIVVTIAAIDLLGINLSIAGIAALLLLIGYSIDTDIVLTNRILKRTQGTVFERIKDAMKTGLTMTLTTLVALTVGFFVTQSYVLKQMFTIMIIGLLFDIIATYAFNAGILRWYVEKKKK